MIRLKGKPLNKGATISQVLINFDGESKSLKKPVYDDKSKTIHKMGWWKNPIN